MPKRLPRLCYQEKLEADKVLTLDKQQSHYLINVLRQQAGAQVRLFNAVDGEWLTIIRENNRKSAVLMVEKQLRPPILGKGLRLAMAPIKKHRMAMIFEKATELGVQEIQPVRTRYCVPGDGNMEKHLPRILEAAEQSERLGYPELKPEMTFEAFLETCPVDDLVWADERGGGSGPLDLMAAKMDAYYFIGPEGGFSSEEARLLQPYQSMNLGNTILRSETACIMIMGLWRALFGLKGG